MKKKEKSEQIKCYCGHTTYCDCSPLEPKKEEAKKIYDKENMIKFAEFVASYPDKNRNYKGEMLHAKSKYDSSERTIDLLRIWSKQFKKK